MRRGLLSGSSSRSRVSALLATGGFDCVGNTSLCGYHVMALPSATTASSLQVLRADTSKHQRRWCSSTDEEVHQQQQHHQQQEYYRSPQELERTLSTRFGPLAQIQSRFNRKGQNFKASATMRQCGFPVELASLERPTQEEAMDAAVDFAMSLDIVFLNPRLRIATASSTIAQAKSTFDDLRQLCTNASRMLRFSVGFDSEKKQYFCRSFVRDEWAANTQLVPFIEVFNESANAALNDCAGRILMMYREEFSAPEKIKEDYLELRSHLAVYKNRSLTEMCQEDPATRTFSVSIQVEDECGNMFQVHSRGARDRNQAYSQAARSVFRLEVDSGAKPLLSLLRWQVGAMCGKLYNAEYHYHCDSSGGTNTGEVWVAANSASLGERLRLSQETSQGTYILELRCLAAAASFLLDKFPTAVADIKVPFVSSKEVAAAMVAHDNFDIVAAHKGKWNSFAALGTITASLVGNHYQTEFEDVPEGAHVSTRAHIFVNDGENSRRLLLSKLGKEKGDCWRQACNEVIRENFPVAYEKLLAVEEYALSTDRVEGSTGKNKGLPRQQRVPHFSTMFNMIQCFGQEDYSWTQMDIRTTQTHNGQWLAEITVIEAGSTKVIFQSDAFLQSKMAKKFAIYAIGKKHWPKETDQYIALERGDFVAADKPELERYLSRVYDSRIPLSTQLARLIEKSNPQLNPVTWKVATMEGGTRYRVTVFGKGSPIADVLADAGESAIATLFRTLRAAANAVKAPTKTLMADYIAATPCNIVSERDLASHLFHSHLGVLPKINSVFSRPDWEQSVVIDLDGIHVCIQKTTANNKKDGISNALILGAKNSFFDILKELAASPYDAAEIAKAILERGGVASRQHESAKEAELNATPAEKLLVKCMNELDSAHTLAFEVSTLSSGTFRMTISRYPHGQQAKSEVVGSGDSNDAGEARHSACLAALENLFGEQFAAEMESDPSICDFHPSVHQQGGGDESGGQSSH